MASVLVAAVTWWILFWIGLIDPILRGADGGEDYLVLGMMPVAIMVLVAAVTLVVVSLLTSPPSKHIVDRFFDLPENDANTQS